MSVIDRTVVGLLVGAAALYLAAWPAFMARRKKTGLCLLGSGWLLNAALLVVNGIAAKAPPFGNMYHVLVVLAACFPSLYAVMARRHKLGWAAAYFTFAAAIPLVGSLFMQRDVHWRRMPALQSYWFVPHVFAYMLSYALAAVAFACMSVKRLRGLLLRQVDARKYEQAAHDILRMAFPLMTFGLLSGALWAEQAWGAYWSWDSKETWSLITWLLYVVYFHCLAGKGPRRVADAAHLLAFAALLTTFLLVSILPRLASALHSYA